MAWDDSALRSGECVGPVFGSLLWVAVGWAEDSMERSSPGFGAWRGSRLRLVVAWGGFEAVWYVMFFASISTVDRI